MNFSNLEVQKNEVKRGLKTALVLRQTWEPINMEWFRSWKVYVDFDNDKTDFRLLEVIISRIF